MRKINKFGSVSFSSGLILEEETIYKACLKALEAIENELPEEARFFEVYNRVIDDCKDVLKEKKVIL